MRDIQSGIDEPLFSVGFAARAAGLKANALHQWLLRYDLPLWKAQGEVEHPGGTKTRMEGGSHRLTLRTVLHIAATARLVDHGAKVRDAYNAAMLWTHRGGGQGGFIAEEADADALPYHGRAPGGLFPSPDITLLVYRDGSDARIARASVHPNGQFSAIPDDLFGAVVATVVNLNEVDRSVREACAPTAAERVAAA